MTIDLERLREEIVAVVRHALSTADQQHHARLRCLLVVEAVTNSFNSHAFTPTILSVDETIHCEQSIDIKHQDARIPIINFNITTPQKRRKPQVPQKIVREEEEEEEEEEDVEEDVSPSSLASQSILQEDDADKDIPIDFSYHRNEKSLEASAFLQEKSTSSSSPKELGQYESLKKPYSNASLFQNLLPPHPLVAHFQQMLAAGSSYYASPRPPIPSILPFGTSVSNSPENGAHSKDSWMSTLSSPLKMSTPANNFMNSSGAATFLSTSGLGFGLNNFASHNAKLHTESMAQQNKNGNSTTTTPTTSFNRGNGHPRATRIGNKIFKCNQCDEKFSSLNLLSKHTFSMHRSFRCTICGANFTQRSNLQRHSLKHVGFKPFVCNCCSKAYYRKDHLVRHIEVTHPGVDPRASITVKLSSSECLEYLERINVNSSINIAAIKAELDLDEEFFKEEFAKYNKSEASFNIECKTEIDSPIQLPLEEGEIIPTPGIDNEESMEYISEEIISDKNDIITESVILNHDYQAQEAEDIDYKNENWQKHELLSSDVTSPLSLNLKHDTEKMKCFNGNYVNESLEPVSVNF